MKRLVLYGITFLILILISCATNTGPRIPMHINKPIFTFQDIQRENIPFPDSYPDANAIVLLREAKFSIQTSEIDAGFFSVNVPWSTFSEHVIIKILRDSGRRYADVKIPFWGRSDILDLKARTITPAGEVIPVSKKEFYEINDLPEYILYSDRKAKIFTFPSVDTGALIEYYYTLGYEGPHVPDWTFQHEEPVYMAKFYYDVPKTMEYKFLYANIPGREIQKEIRDTGERRCAVFTCRDLPPLTTEPLAPPIPDVSCWIKMAWKSMFLWIKEISSGVETWYQIGRTYSAVFDSLTECDANIREKALEITAGCATDEGKITAIHGFIQDAFRYVAIDIEGHNIAPNKPAAVLKNRYGDCKDLAGLMSSLLSAVSIKSFPVLVTTKDNGQFIDSFPTPSQFNHVILAIPLDHFPDAAGLKNAVTYGDNNLIRSDDYLIVDPTARVHPMGSIPASIEGQRAVLCAKDDSRRITLPQQQGKDNGSLTTLTITFNGSDYDGTARIRLSGEPAAFMRYQLTSRGTQTTREIIHARLSEYSLAPDLDTFAIENRDARDEPLFCTMKIHKKNAVIRVSEQIVLPIVFYTPKEFLAIRSQQTRRHNIYFPYPYMHQDLIKIHYPQDMQIFKLPEKQKQVFAWGAFEITSYVSGDTIIVQRAYTINERNISRDHFNEFKEFASLIVDSGNNPIILTPKK